MEVLDKFIELTKWTYVLGEEYQLESFLPSNLSKDEIGNYFIKIGESDTMFCSHLDTAAVEKEKVIHVRAKNKQGDLMIGTDGRTLLGADDKAGTIIMLNMIEKEIPGLYYFFIGEESGLVGSKGAINLYSEEFSKYKKCISFDRKGYGSIISCQMGGRCCSVSFVNSLSDEFRKNGMEFTEDKTGIYTDSAVFMDLIPECTNISVGYFNEHTVKEYQNITYLEELVEATALINWDSLVIKRDNTPIDTPNPIRKPKTVNDLSDDELTQVFFDVDDILENILGVSCANFEYFIPEKEMLYLDPYNDGEQEDITTLVIHENGSISIASHDYDSFELFEDDMVNKFGYIKPIPVPEKQLDVQLESGDFESGLDIKALVKDFNLYAIDNDVDYINPKEIVKILDKYNKRIEGLIIWLYQQGNDTDKTHGLYWDDDNVCLGIEI